MWVCALKPWERLGTALGSQTPSAGSSQLIKTFFGLNPCLDGQLWLTPPQQHRFHISCKTFLVDMLTLSILGALEFHPSLPPIQKHSDNGRLCYGYDSLWLSWQVWGNISLIDWSLTSNSFFFSVDTEAITPGPMKPGRNIGPQMEFPVSVFSPYSFSREQYSHSVSLLFCLIMFSMYGFHSLQWTGVTTAGRSFPVHTQKC